MINIQSETISRRKSEKLSTDELRQLKKFVSSFNVIVAAAENIGIHRNVLDLVLIKGSGSPETIAAIRAKLAA